MTLAIIGCRWFSDTTLFLDTIEEFKDSLTRVVTGGASGADKMAEIWASLAGVPVTVLPADWRKYGKAAGPIRNRLIIEEADQVLAFWDGSSKGTGGAIKMATDRGIPVLIVPITKS